MAGKGGGAWKVAYADFVTAMMAFFLVMWITAQNSAVKESIAQYFENPLGTALEARATSVHGIAGASAQAPLEGQQAGPHGSNQREVGTNALGGNGKSLGGGRPQLRIFERLDKTRAVGTMIVFPKHSAELSDEAKAQLSALVPELLGKPNKVEIRGHASRGALPADSPYADLWQISFARALSTMDYLIDHGVEASRIRLSQDAAYEPYSRDGNEVEDPRNARVEVFAVDELAYEFKKSTEERAGDFVEMTDAHVETPPAPPAAAGHGAKDGHGGHGAKDGHGGHGAKDAHGGHGAKDAHGGKGGHGAEKAGGGHGKPAASDAKHGHGAKENAAAKDSGHGKAKGHGGHGH